MREKLAEALASRIRPDTVVGIGTGSTVSAAIEKIARRVREENLRFMAVPTSLQTAHLCEQSGIAVLYPGFRGEISWGFDGADAVDPGLNLVKGKGAALLQEKVLAARCRSFVVIVDEGKLVPTLDNYPIPVEVLPEAIAIVEREIPKLGASSMTLRPAQGKHGPIITEKGNLIYDVTFPHVSPELEDRLKAVVGVVESGLFTRYVTEVLIGTKSGVDSRLKR